MPHPYGWLSLLPPVAAIVLAIVTRRVVVSLLAGIFVGTLILNHGNPFAAVGEALETHLWETAIDEGNLRLFAFTLLMGGMVGVLSASGGMQGLIQLVTPWARDRRRGQLTTWAAGMLIFFDDYANTILLGNTLRPLCDRLRISREKLSFIVDSTAAPVAGIAPLATWVAIEVELIGDGLSSVAAAADQSVPGAFELFLYSIPYRFYPIWMLVFVPLVAVLLRDFGPMRRAERMTIDDQNSPGRLAIDIDDEQRVPARWFNAVVPIVVTLAVVMVLLYTTGRAGLREKQAATIVQDAQVTPLEPASPAMAGTPARLRDILGEADSSFALAYASLAGLVLAVALVRVQRILSWDQIGRACDRGIRAMLPALVILICAMTLSGMTKGNPAEDADRPFQQQDVKLYAAYYLSGLLLGEAADGDAASGEPMRSGGLSARRELLQWSLPTVVFLLAAVISFCTGTSFGTMGILMPMTVPLVFDVLGGVGSASAGNPILLGTIGGVLAGSIFGDHCSPISDTTVLSSQASACDHLAHVWTQMPYALTVGGVAILCGTLPLGLGVPVWLLLPLGVIVLVGVLIVFGKRD